MADPSLPIAESADDDTSHSSPLVPEAKRTHPTRLSALSQAARQAWQDLKTVRLRTATLEFFLYLAWAGVLLGFLIFLAIFGSGNLVEAVCKPDGTFSSSPYNFKYWTTGFFEISLAFGAFSFTEVKALDVAFQLVRPSCVRSSFPLKEKFSRLSGMVAGSVSNYQCTIGRRPRGTGALGFLVMEGVLSPCHR